MDPNGYAERAEAFVAELDREYYLHFSGQKPDFEIEPVYERHADLFTRDAVERLRERADVWDGGDAERRARYLLAFAVEGHLGQATKAEVAALAEREAALELDVGGKRMPYRASTVVQANEADAGRRAAIEAGRLELLASELMPLHLAAFERTRELVDDLGWSSYREMCEELSGIDLAALAEQTQGFLEATEGVYPEIADPELERVVGGRLGEVRRSDLPRFFRAPDLDSHFPDERLVASFVETMAAIGIDVDGQDNVVLDTEERPTKSPRAFCAPVDVPGEVYLVVPRVGGRDDYSALFHEGGHTEHYANVDAGHPFEFRHLGDNSVTESFAFLLQNLTEEGEWLRGRLGVDDVGAVVSHARATKLVFLRRYAAKIAYELELHDATARLERMPSRYAELLGGSTRIEWPDATWLADVDGGFYVACYLRAWALETRWRQALRERFGERWFEEPEAGRWLMGLWSEGQRLPADELLAETLGEELDFRVLVEEFAAGARA